VVHPLAIAASDQAVKLFGAGDDVWRGPVCLLLGIAATGHSTVESRIDTAMNRLRKALVRADGWTDTLAHLDGAPAAPTGRAWTAVDAYGDRYGLVKFRHRHARNIGITTREISVLLRDEQRLHLTRSRPSDLRTYA
jgi:hypothetical protein